MGATDIGLFVSVGVNVVTLYGLFRKTKTDARLADADADAAQAKHESDIEDRVIARWQAYASEREAQAVREQARTQGQLEQVARELEAARKEGGDCRERAARQEERIEHLTAELRAMKAALKAHGIRQGSGEHEPLKG